MPFSARLNHYRFYDNDSTAQAATALFAEDVTATFNITAASTDIQFSLRVQLLETGGVTGGGGDDYRIEADKNGGGFFDVTAASTGGIRTDGTSSLEDNTDIPAARLTTPASGDFDTGEQSEFGLVNNRLLRANNHTEFQYSLYLDASEVTTGDVFQIQIRSIQHGDSVSANPAAYIVIGEAVSSSGIATWSPGDNEHVLSAHGVTISDATKFGIFQTQFTNSNTSIKAREAGDAMLLESTAQIRRLQRSEEGTRRIVSWGLENSQDSSAARNFKVQHLLYSVDVVGSAVSTTYTRNLNSDPNIGAPASIVAPIDEVTLSINASVDGQDDYPLGAIDIGLLSANAITFTESDASQEKRIGVELIEWPEDEISGIFNLVEKATNSVGRSLIGKNLVR